MKSRYKWIHYTHIPVIYHTLCAYYFWTELKCFGFLRETSGPSFPVHIMLRLGLCGHCSYENIALLVLCGMGPRSWFPECPCLTEFIYGLSNERLPFLKIFDSKWIYFWHSFNDFDMLYCVKLVCLHFALKAH